MIKLIKEQIKLIKEKDPAVNSIFEVLLYPSLKVQIYYKISHYLYLKKHYFLARLISEKAKRKRRCTYTLCQLHFIPPFHRSTRV